MNSSFGRPHCAHPLLHVLRHARVVGDEVEPALLIGLVLLQDLAAALVGGLGIVVVQPDVVGAERTVVVAVGLAVGDRVELVERLAPAGVEDAQQQLVLRRIVAVGLRERDAVVGMIGQAEAVAVGLHSPVALAVFAGSCRADPRQHAALRIARHDVGTDRLLQDAEVMPMVQDAGLDAVPLLAVGRL